ncbi:hypothetical protein SERLA73DRAFT_149166 [Serpula lacrymans var. lacrymans S7.3]|uniref:Uncharacterized protein n=1 Tax=Serpula lacrymans var. lacrymans (strain S7.3) TaxID=936435 RepID=F8PFY5_SERL3|nr:hypothetical protein SERLA73DRAFT_149166 [Serpula lacrymans var. lacrymans S7.3]
MNLRACEQAGTTRRHFVREGEFPTKDEVGTSLWGLKSSQKKFVVTVNDGWGKQITAMKGVGIRMEGATLNAICLVLAGNGEEELPGDEAETEKCTVAGFDT